MNKKPNGYWTFERCKEEALKYKYLKDFRKQYTPYNKSIKKGWFNDIGKHLITETERIQQRINYNEFINIKESIYAYILGLIWADGWLSKNHSINISCKYENSINSDYNTYSKILDNTGKWNKYHRNRFDKRTNKFYGSGQFNIVNKPLYNFLIEMDYDRKSYVSPTKILNNIPKKLHSHFFRGYSDGDGSFYYNYINSATQFTITSTFEQDWTFIEKIYKNLNIEKYEIKRVEGNKSNYSQVRVVNKWDIMKLSEWMYKDSVDSRLERKYDTYMSIVDADIKKMSPDWTHREIDFLKEHYRSKGVKYCMNKLDRSKYSIQSRVSRIGKEKFV